MSRVVPVVALIIMVLGALLVKHLQTLERKRVALQDEVFAASQALLAERSDCLGGFSGSVIWHTEAALARGEKVYNLDQYRRIKARCSEIGIGQP